jgi:chitinase
MHETLSRRDTMRRSRLKTLLLTATIPLRGLLLGTGPSASAAVNPGSGFPAHFAAPYVETSTRSG